DSRGGHRVGGLVAPAGPRRGDEVLARRERPLGRGGERGLLGTRLVRAVAGARERSFERTAGCKHVLHAWHDPTGANGRSLPLVVKNPLFARFCAGARLTVLR